MSEVENNKVETPWLTFRIKDKLFAVNTKYVENIVNKVDKLSKIPYTSENVRGVFNLMGKVIPVVDMRILFGLPTIDNEVKTFFNEIDKRKDEHNAWVERLLECLNQGIQPDVLVDHKYCKFGQWFYSFETDNQNLQFVLKKIEEPHAKLHSLAKLKIEDLKNNVEELENTKKLAVQYREKVLNLLDEMKEPYKEAYKELWVVVGNEENKIGITVDEVISAGDITIIDREKQNEIVNTYSWVNDVAVLADNDIPIFVVEGEVFINTLLKEV